MRKAIVTTRIMSYGKDQPVPHPRSRCSRDLITRLDSPRALISDSPRSPIQPRGICYFAKGVDSCKLFREETAPDRRALHQFGELMARVFGRAVPGIEVQEVARRHPRGPF